MVVPTVLDLELGTVLSPFRIDDPRRLVGHISGERLVGLGQDGLGPHHLELVVACLTAGALGCPVLGSSHPGERVDGDDFSISLLGRARARDEPTGFDRHLLVDQQAELVELLVRGPQELEKSLLSALFDVELHSFVELHVEGLDEVPDLGRGRGLADLSEQEPHVDQSLSTLVCSPGACGHRGLTQDFHVPIAHPSPKGFDLGGRRRAGGSLQNTREPGSVVPAGGSRAGEAPGRTTRLGDRHVLQGRPHVRSRSTRMKDGRQGGRARGSPERRDDERVVLLDPEVRECDEETLSGPLLVLQAPVARGLGDRVFRTRGLFEDDEDGKSFHFTVWRKHSLTPTALHGQGHLGSHVVFLHWGCWDSGTFCGLTIEKPISGENRIFTCRYGPFNHLMTLSR